MTRPTSLADIVPVLRAPVDGDDKFSRGVVGLRTGSPTYPGAAVLGVSAAWRAGAGMVRWTGDADVGRLILQRRPETVLRAGRADCWVIGSGTDAAERTAEERDELSAILGAGVPVVVDAGALDLVAPHDVPLVLTPHAGEFARLRHRFGLEASADRAADAEALADTAECVVVLKGAHTLVAAPGEKARAVVSGVPWLATAGTGDVLAGVIGTVIAQASTAALVDAVVAAVWLHGRAAAHASGRTVADADEPSDPGHPITALDVVDALPLAVHDMVAFRG